MGQQLNVDGISDAQRGGPSVAKSLGCDAAKAVVMQQLVLRPVIG